MNKHILTYHTRLHEWYRQHSIQHEKQQQGQQPPQQQQTSHSCSKVVGDTGAGALTQDKLHFINDWCSNVNRTLFQVKKKESPPLFRRCRLSANSSCITRTADDERGRLAESGKERAVKSADPRRIRSAEVFTLSGHWGKQPKAVVNGGELLGSNKQRKTLNLKGDHKKTANSSSQIELCVTNSKDAEEEAAMTLPRMNHDSLTLRQNALVLRQNAGRPEYTAGSPRGSLGVPDKSSVQINAARRVKSAAPDSIRYDAVLGGREQLNNRIEGRPRSQKEMEIVKNAKNNKYNQMKTVDEFRPARSRKEDLKDQEDDDEDKQLAKTVIDVVVTDDIKNIQPTFCSKCSGIYSREPLPDSRPTTCGDCIHGINIGNGSDTKAEDAAKAAKAVLEADIAKALAEKEKMLDKKIAQADVEVKQVENRLTEDSLHYSCERDTIRHSGTKPTLALTNTFDDLEDDRNISFDDDQNSHSDVNDLSSSRSEKSNCSDKDNNLQNGDISISHVEPTGCLHNPDRNTRKLKRMARVTIQTDEASDDEGPKEKNTDKDASIASDDGPPDPELLKKYQDRRGSRRMSISFTYKPTVGNISTSNNLLRVLSIDDCKVNMRYSPHKVLDEHEVTDNVMASLDMLKHGSFSIPETGDKGRKAADKGESGKVAMRISKGSSGVTSLQSSSALGATRANKKHYQILYDPDDLDFYRNKRPSSACLARAFHTLIHDRTVMQRLDAQQQQLQQQQKERYRLRSAYTTKEGPCYKRINAALKRHMGQMMQGQRAQLLNKYERQKNGLSSAGLSKRGKQTKGDKDDLDATLTSNSHSLSLSLDSLPVTKKGILKNAINSTENLATTSINPLPNGHTDTEQ